MNTTIETQTLSRRSVLRGLAGGGLAGIVALSGISQVDAAKKSKKGKDAKELDAKTEREITRLAEIAGAALSISGAADKGRRGSSKKQGKKGGRLVLDEGKLDGLSSEQRSLLKELVADVNSGKLGFALKNDSGRVVSQVGSKKALDGGEGTSDEGGNGREGRWSYWTDRGGMYFYVDPVWNARIRIYDRNAIGFIAGLLRNLWQQTGVVNFTFATVVNFVWYQLVPRIRLVGATQSWVFAAFVGNAWVNVGRGWVMTPYRT
jgi:hypothetical protein